MAEIQDFREAIKTSLKKQGLTQKSLAVKIGYNEQNFSTWMRGNRTIPVETLQKIIIELDIKLLV